MLPGFGKEKPPRPYFKICSKCHGKGQLSYFNAGQDKTYSACRKCTNGNPPTGLGVTLKCSCQELSSPYEYLTVEELKYMKHMDKGEKERLLALQDQLGSHGTALLITCDNCGARYLAKDKGGRCKIRGDEAINGADKAHNKAIAEALVETGILYKLETVRARGAGANGAGGRGGAAGSSAEGGHHQHRTSGSGGDRASGGAGGHHHHHHHHTAAKQ